MSFAQRLRKTRKEKGFSQEELSEKLGVSRQTVTKWESGIAYPELRKLIELAVVLGKELDWFLQDEIGNSLYQNGRQYRSFDGSDHKMKDREALQKAKEEDYVCRVLQALNGFETEMPLKTERFCGKQRIIIYQETVFIDVSGTMLTTGEDVDVFQPVLPHSLRELQQCLDASADWIPWKEKGGNLK